MGSHFNQVGYELSGVIECDTVCCSVLRCVAVCCSMLQCVEVWTTPWDHISVKLAMSCRLIHVCYDSFICVIRRVRMCDMTHLRESAIKTHSNVSHDAFIRVTRLIHMCDMTHACV